MGAAAVNSNFNPKHLSLNPYPWNSLLAALNSQVEALRGATNKTLYPGECPARRTFSSRATHPLFLHRKALNPYQQGHESLWRLCRGCCMPDLLGEPGGKEESFAGSAVPEATNPLSSQSSRTELTMAPLTRGTRLRLKVLVAHVWKRATLR